MASPVVTTRVVTPEDVSLLLEVFVSGEGGAWAALLPNIDNGPVLRRMFAAQQNEYTERFPAAYHQIILIDGEPAGQVRWAERDDDIHVVDIGLLPQHRRRGAAAAIYTRLLEHARAAGKPLRSSVSKMNGPSITLHQRFGFIVESENESHYFLIAR